jgi:hypothetical protein
MNKIKIMVLGLTSLFVGSRRGATLSPLWNEAAATTRSADHWKRKTAMAIGKPELATAPDEELEKAHDEHMTAMSNEMDTTDAAAAEMSNERKTEMGSLLGNAVTEGRLKAEDRAGWEKKFATDFDGSKTALAALKKPEPEDPAAVAIANERKERMGDLLANAIETGRIKPADRKTWEGDFEKDFAGTKTKLANTKAGSAIKTTSTTRGLGDRSAAIADEKSRADQVQTLVNEKQAKGMTYDAAFDAVRREKPALFEAMQQPEAKK